MNLEETKYCYEAEYASGILRKTFPQTTYIVSNKKLENGQFVIIEHLNSGVFIGRIVRKEKDKNLFDNEYRYLQDIDLSSWWNNLERKKRIEELNEEMAIRMELIDNEKKKEYYAEIDSDFRELYLEYERLKNENN